MSTCYFLKRHQVIFSLDGQASNISRLRDSLMQMSIVLYISKGLVDWLLCIIDPPDDNQPISREPAHRPSRPKHQVESIEFRVEKEEDG